jgi:hypothetical protein
VIASILVPISGRRLGVCCPVLALLCFVTIVEKRHCDGEKARQALWNVAVAAERSEYTEWDAQTQEWSLKIVAKYCGDKAIQIPCSDLPWKWIYATKMAAIRIDTLGEQLKQDFPVSDPPCERVLVRPGQVLSGTVRLSRRFPTLAKELEKGSVIVFWALQLGAADRLGGWVEIASATARKTSPSPSQTTDDAGDMDDKGR